MNDCLFCNIIKREIPSDIVFEDEHTLAFLDINPNNLGHTLVIPKDHHENLGSTPLATLTNVMETSQKVGKAIMKGMEVEGFNVIQNNGSVAGQAIFHIHFHIIPRVSDDGLRHWPHKKYESPEEAAAVAKKITDAIS